MSDSDSDQRRGSHGLKPPPLISGGTSYSQSIPAVLPLINQHLPTAAAPGGGGGYLILPHGTSSPQMQVIQGLDGTLYAIHSQSPSSTHHHHSDRTQTLTTTTTILPVRSPIDTTAQVRTTCIPPQGVFTPALQAATGSQQVPLVPIYAPVPVAQPLAKKYQQIVRLPSTEGGVRQVSQLESSVPTLNQYHAAVKQRTFSQDTSDSLQSPLSVSPNSVTYSPIHNYSSGYDAPTITSNNIMSPTQHHHHRVQSPTFSAITEGLSSVQRASILQQHRRSLAYIHEKETQDYTTSQSAGESSGSRSSTSSVLVAVTQQKEEISKGSSLKKLLLSESEAKSSFTEAESSTDDSFALLKNEPYLVRFFEFFQTSERSSHLRMRVLTTEGSSSVLKWIEVTRRASHIDSNLGPLDAVRILISSNGLCKMQLLFPYCKTLFTRFMPSSLLQANELFNELSPTHVLCPGIPDCESKIAALGYHPGSVRMIKTPTVKRFDHEKCPLWHIPLPCNMYSESGQIMHHMCRQCKNLHNTLNRTVAKICRFSSTDHFPTAVSVQNHSESTSSRWGSTREGQLKPPKEKRQKRKASLETTSAGVSTSDSAAMEVVYSQGEEGTESRHHIIEFYKSDNNGEDNEPITTRHGSEDATVESSVIVISEGNSRFGVTTSSAERTTKSRRRHTVIDSTGRSESEIVSYAEVLTGSQSEIRHVEPSVDQDSSKKGIADCEGVFAVSSGTSKSPSRKHKQRTTDKCIGIKKCRTPTSDSSSEL